VNSGRLFELILHFRAGDRLPGSFRPLLRCHVLGGFLSAEFATARAVLPEKLQG
jgi:hypothetical protein